MEVITTERVRGYIPERNPKGDKYSFGKVLCISGAIGYTGAPYFASLAAQRSGCGLVRLIVPDSIWTIEATKLNEVMVIPVDDDEEGRISSKSVDTIMDYASKADAVLIGPGCGINRGIQTIVKSLLTTLTVPLVIDADGINVLCEDTDMLKYASCPTVITPHAKEFARLFGKRIIPNKKTLQEFPEAFFLSRRLPIFTSRFQLTIFGTSKLNFCVRNGNRWNLTVIDTDQSD